MTKKSRICRICENKGYNTDGFMKYSEGGYICYKCLAEKLICIKNRFYGEKK